MKEHLETCKHFLVDIEIDNKRHIFYNFAMDTVDPKYLFEKLDVVFDTHKCAVKLNVAFRFALKNLENGRFR